MLERTRFHHLLQRLSAYLLVFRNHFCYDGIGKKREEEEKFVAEYVLRLRRVLPEEILSEQEILARKKDAPFLGPGDRPEPYRSYYMIYARLEPVFQKEKVHPPLLVDTPIGRGLHWRLWRDQVGIVLLKITGNDTLLEEKVTFVSRNELTQITYILDEIVLNPPKW